MKITRPKNWRFGQTFFNFFEWLKTNKDLDSNQSIRMADPFYVNDKDFIKYYKEFLKEVEGK